MYLSLTQNICLPRDYFFLVWFLFVGMYLSVPTNAYLGTFFLGWFLFVGVYLSVTQNICLPRGYYFFEWFLFVGMYLSVSQNIYLPRDYYFLGWFLFVGMFLSLTSHYLPKSISVLVSFQVLHFCPGTTFVVMVSFCVHVFVNHSNISMYL